MAYDEKLAERIRAAIGPRERVDEKKMFGGVAFMLDGKMFIGIVKDELMVRVGPEAHARAIAQPHARAMDFTGRPMVGYIYVAKAGCGTVPAVRKWAERALEHVATLPRKKVRPKKKKAPTKQRANESR